MIRRINYLFFPLLASILLGGGGAALAEMSRGQTLYVPAYSHIYQGMKSRPFPLTITLSFRNIDPVRSLTLFSVNYYDSQGALVKELVSAPLTVNPLESKEYIIEQKDHSGGAGANFIVRWSSETPLNTPIVEAVMIGSSSNQGISFRSTSRQIDLDRTED